MVEENARRILQTAEKYRVTPYVMSKQFGRNPWLTQQIIALGFSGAVAVDFREARCLANSGVPLRHLGHLVQIPDGKSKARCDAGRKSSRSSHLTKRTGSPNAPGVSAYGNACC